jgi:flavin-dependent dehydrogenase
MSGVELPERDVFIYTHGFPQETGAMCFIVPQANEGEYNIIITTGDPRLDLEVAFDYFINRESCASWFQKAKKLKALSAVNNMYAPIVEPYKNRVLVAGDVGASFELEITGAMISGWKAGQAISTAVQEENLELEVAATSLYSNWWKEIYINPYKHDPRRMFALLYALTKEDEIDYVLGLIKDTLPASWNPGTIGRAVAEAMGKAIPIIQQERPETFKKLQRASMLDEIFAELTKISKPV